MATSFVTMICYDDIYKSFFWHHNFSRGQMNESIFRLAIEQPLGPWFEFPERSRAYCILSICKMRFHQFSLGRKISLRQKQNDYIILFLGHAAVATRVVHFRWQASQWPRMTIWTFSRARLLPQKKKGGGVRSARYKFDFCNKYSYIPFSRLSSLRNSDYAYKHD